MPTLYIYIYVYIYIDLYISNISIINYNSFFAWNLWRASSGIAKGWCCCSCLLCEIHFQFYSRTHVHLFFESMDKVTPKQIEKCTTWKYEEHIIELYYSGSTVRHLFGGCDVCIHVYSFLFIFIHIYSYLFIFIHIYSYLFIFIHIYSYLFIFIHIYSYLFIFIHIYSYLFIFIHIYSYLFIFIHIYMSKILKYCRIKPQNTSDFVKGC